MPTAGGSADNRPMTRRYQFSLKWLFVAILVVAAFFGGMVVQRESDSRKLNEQSAKIRDLKEKERTAADVLRSMPNELARRGLRKR